MHSVNNVLHLLHCKPSQRTPSLNRHSHRAPSVAESMAEYFDASEVIMCETSSEAEASDESGLSDITTTSNSEPEEGHGECLPTSRCRFIPSKRISPTSFVNLNPYLSSFLLQLLPPSATEPAWTMPLTNPDQCSLTQVMPPLMWTHAVNECSGVSCAMLDQHSLLFSDQ